MPLEGTYLAVALLNVYWPKVSGWWLMLVKLDAGRPPGVRLV